MRSTLLILCIAAIACILLYLYPVPFLLTAILVASATAGKGRSKWGRRF